MEVEVEALQHTYDTVKAYQNSEGDVCVEIPLSPYTGAGDSGVFVSATMVLSAGALYPEEAPRVSFRDVKGMSDAHLSHISSRLHEEMAAAPGEVILMTLCMAAQEAITELNFPEGPHAALSSTQTRVDLCVRWRAPALLWHMQRLATSQSRCRSLPLFVRDTARLTDLAPAGACPFCLEEMRAGEACLRGGCHHGFHTACFALWWRWYQRHWAAEEAALLAHLGSESAARQLKVRARARLCTRSAMYVELHLHRILCDGGPKCCNLAQQSLR
jgi:RWD domain